MKRNMKAVSRGKKVSLDAIRQQGRVSEGLSITFEADVAEAGFSATDKQSLTSKLTLLDSESAELVESRAQSKANRVAEVKAIADAKWFKRRLDLATRDLYAREEYEDGFSMPVAEEVFRPPQAGGVKSSTPRLLGYLAHVRPHVEKVKTLLAPYFGGADVLALLDSVASELKAADTVQEVALDLLPEDQKDVYQLKGEVLFLIERLNRAGRAAFDGDAGKAALFNKDRLLRARRSGMTVVEGDKPANKAG